MEKDEILKKAQNNKNYADEMEMEVIKKGTSVSMSLMLLFALILMITKIATKQVWYDAYSIIFISVAGLDLYN